MGMYVTGGLAWVSWATVRWALVVLVLVSLMGLLFGVIAARFNPTDECPEEETRGEMLR